MKIMISLIVVAIMSVGIIGGAFLKDIDFPLFVCIPIIVSICLGAYQLKKIIVDKNGELLRQQLSAHHLADDGQTYQVYKGLVFLAPKFLGNILAVINLGSNLVQYVRFEDDSMPAEINKPFRIHTDEFGKVYTMNV